MTRLRNQLRRQGRAPTLVAVHELDLAGHASPLEEASVPKPRPDTSRHWRGSSPNSAKRSSDASSCNTPTRTSRRARQAVARRGPQGRTACPVASRRGNESVATAERSGCGIAAARSARGICTLKYERVPKRWFFHWGSRCCLVLANPGIRRRHTSVSQTLPPAARTTSIVMYSIRLHGDTELLQRAYRTMCERSTDPTPCSTQSSYQAQPDRTID